MIDCKKIMYRCCSLGVICILLLMGCNSNSNSTKHSVIEPKPFQFKDIAKSDVDLVAETHLKLTLEQLEILMEKLYRRNPRERRKSGVAHIDVAVAKVFGPDRQSDFPALQGKRSVDSMRLAFEDSYHGDRILALMEGLRGMVLDSYNGQQEFYLLDELDPQKMHNAARNVEIAVWKLSNDKDAEGRLYLLSNEMSDAAPNLSFERLFGKIIALQDSIAIIVSDATNRRIKNVIQSAASAVFMGI